MVIQRVTLTASIVRMTTPSTDALRALFHFQSPMVSKFGVYWEENRPEKIRLWTAHCRCIVSTVPVESIATLIQCVDLCKLDR